MGLEYIPPSFLENESVDEIHKKMLEILPEDIDKSEGQYPWDFTRPTAIELARIMGFSMNEAVKLIFPEFSEGIWLDYHAMNRGIVRKKSNPAMGELLILGMEGTVIPKGSIFTTETKNDIPAIEYETIKKESIAQSGSIVVQIICREKGIIGNTAVNTVVLKSSNIDGISKVTNEEAITGGIPEETDESLKERITEYDRVQGVSFVGSISDYKRWAQSVPGTGEAIIIPASDDTGLVTIVLTDGNGEPATEQLCTQVYNKIMSPKDISQRIAPVNAVLNVVPPVTIDITINAVLELKDITIEQCKAELLKALRYYFQTATQDQEIRYSQIGRILGSIPGVYDYKDLLVNNGKENIIIKINELPIIEESGILLSLGII